MNLEVSSLIRTLFLFGTGILVYFYLIKGLALYFMEVSKDYTKAERIWIKFPKDFCWAVSKIMKSKLYRHELKSYFVEGHKVLILDINDTPFSISIKKERIDGKTIIMLKFVVFYEDSSGRLQPLEMPSKYADSLIKILLHNANNLIKALQ